MEWTPSVLLTIFVLAASIIGGYAVLRKRVKDLEKDNEKKLDEEDHDKLCKIAGLEMKNHVSDVMKNTFDDFRKEVFLPEMDKLFKAINGG